MHLVTQYKLVTAKAKLLFKEWNAYCRWRSPIQETSTKTRSTSSQQIILLPILIGKKSSWQKLPLRRVYSLLRKCSPSSQFCALLTTAPLPNLTLIARKSSARCDVFTGKSLIVPTLVVGGWFGLVNLKSSGKINLFQLFHKTSEIIEVSITEVRCHRSVASFRV